MTHSAKLFSRSLALILSTVFSTASFLNWAAVPTNPSQPAKHGKPAKHAKPAAQKKIASKFFAKDLTTAENKAKRANKFVMVEIASGQKALGKTFYENKEVKKLIHKIAIPVLVSGAPAKGLISKFKISSLPAVLLLTPSGKSIGRFDGVKDPTSFVAAAKASLKKLSEKAKVPPKRSPEQVKEKVKADLKKTEVRKKTLEVITDPAAKAKLIEKANVSPEKVKERATAAVREREFKKRLHAGMPQVLVNARSKAKASGKKGPDLVILTQQFQKEEIAAYKARVNADVAAALLSNELAKAINAQTELEWVYVIEPQVYTEYAPSIDQYVITNLEPEYQTISSETYLYDVVETPMDSIESSVTEISTEIEITQVDESVIESESLEVSTQELSETEIQSMDSEIDEEIQTESAEDSLDIDSNEESEDIDSGENQEEDVAYEQECIEDAQAEVSEESSEEGNGGGDDSSAGATEDNGGGDDSSSGAAEDNGGGDDNSAGAAEDNGGGDDNSAGAAEDNGGGDDNSSGE